MNIKIYKKIEAKIRKLFGCDEMNDYMQWTDTNRWFKQRSDLHNS